jgi:hypothetical protein
MSQVVTYDSLRPRYAYWLKHGLPKPRGESARMVRDRSGEAPTRTDRYEHQSSPRLVMKLLIEAKSQDVWDTDRVRREMLDPSNRGASWLHCQDNPEGTFADMWARALKHKPQLSEEQVMQQVLRLIKENPGIQLVRLRELVDYNRGFLDSILQGFIDRGELREERTVGPSGTRCTSRRFWFIAKESATAVARSATVAVSLGLLALATATSTTGLRTTAGGVSFRVLLTNKRLRAAGLRRWRSMAAKTRERKQTQAGLRRPTRQPEPHRLSDPELERLLVDLDL